MAEVTDGAGLDVERVFRQRLNGDGTGACFAQALHLDFVVGRAPRARRGQVERFFAVAVADIYRNLKRVEDALQRRLVVAADVAGVVAGGADAAERDGEVCLAGRGRLQVEGRGLEADARGAETHGQRERPAGRDAGGNHRPV